MSASLRDQRAARLRDEMTKAGFDVLLVAGDCWRSDFIRYAIDVTPVEGLAVALFRRDGAPTQVFVESPAEAARYVAEQPALQLSWSPSPIAAAEAALASQGTQRLALAPSHLMPLRLVRKFGSDTIGRATTMVEWLMQHKLREEADAMARTTALTDEGYTYFREIARVGRKEYEVLADMEAWFRSRGCAEHFIIMGSGGQELRSMHPPGERKLRQGDLVTSEVTPCLDGYYAQICRTMVLGEPTQVQLDAHRIYVEALEAGIAAVKPGATHGDVAKALNDVFRAKGMGEYVTNAYTRVRGHGMGLYVDESHVLEDVKLVLEPEMVIVVHPNTYNPNAGYMVLGDMVRVTQTGCEVLTKTPRELFVVPA